jgi:hypothetical protein
MQRRRVDQCARHARKCALFFFFFLIILLAYVMRLLLRTSAIVSLCELVVSTGAGTDGRIVECKHLAPCSSLHSCIIMHVVVCNDLLSIFYFGK